MPLAYEEWRTFPTIWYARNGSALIICSISWAPEMVWKCRGTNGTNKNEFPLPSTSIRRNWILEFRALSGRATERNRGLVFRETFKTGAVFRAGLSCTLRVYRQPEETANFAMPRANRVSLAGSGVRKRRYLARSQGKGPYLRLCRAFPDLSEINRDQFFCRTPDVFLCQTWLTN